MIKHIEAIKKGLEACEGRRCRKCPWRDGFSGACTLIGEAIKYIDALERDNAKEMTYCKDCIYCKKTDATYHFKSDKYECTNREGLPFTLAIDPMDYCSRGKRND